MDKGANLPSCDVLVIGSGRAGLRAVAAVRKENPKLSVVVATKMMPSRNATCMAEGGINGVTDFSNGDSYKYMLMILSKTELIWWIKMRL